MTSHDEQQALALRLQERALLMANPGQSGDYLVLADATLLAALAGVRLLTPGERAALAASPLTLRRFRQLSLQARSANAGPAAAASSAHVTQAGCASVAAARSETGNPTVASASADTGSAAAAMAAMAANDADWCGSAGMLRAAATAPESLASLLTDDHCWSLHFVEHDGAWRVILALSAQAPFAARLLGEQPLLHVIDGGGAIVLQGRLDADGECECAWPFATAPAPHFQLHGAGFTVQPALPVAF